MFLRDSFSCLFPSGTRLHRSSRRRRSQPVASIGRDSSSSGQLMAAARIEPLCFRSWIESSEAGYACEVMGTEFRRDARTFGDTRTMRGWSVSVEKHGRCIGRPLSLYSSRALDQRTNTIQPIRSDARTLACKRHTQTRTQARAAA